MQFCNAQVRPLLERRTKSHTGRRADCGSWLTASLLVLRARGSGRQRATSAPGEQGVQFTAPSQELHVANRDFGTVRPAMFTASVSILPQPD
jgi:hypothetical protein